MFEMFCIVFAVAVSVTLFIECYCSCVQIKRLEIRLEHAERDIEALGYYIGKLIKQKNSELEETDCEEEDFGQNETN